MVQIGRDFTLTWLGHSTFLLQTPGGKRILLDPWVSGNPACPAQFKQGLRPDAMLITHGHFDHVGEAVALGKESGATVVANYEIVSWLERQGLTNLIGMNYGGTVNVADIKVAMVPAAHTSGLMDPECGRMIYGGAPCGYIIELENGYRIYDAGDTTVFGDMKLIGELWQPDLALLPIGDLYTMAPHPAAVAARLLGVRYVVPMHHSTFDMLTGKPEALVSEARSRFDVIALQPGESLR